MITAPSAALREALSNARLVIQRSTLPIFSTVLVNARPENAWLTLTGASGDGQIAVDVEADITEALSGCVAAERLAAALDVPGEEVKITMEKDRMKIAVGRSVFRIPYLPEQDFPLILSQGAASTSFPCEWLGAEIARVLPFVGDDTEVRPYCRGVTVEGVDGEVRLLASSGHCAAKSVRAAESKGAFNVILPRRICEAVKRIKPTRMIVKPGEVLFLGENVQLISKLIEGLMPDLSNHFPSGKMGRFVADRKAVIGAVKSCAALTDIRMKAVRIGMNGKGGVVEIVGNEGSEGRIELDASGESFEFGMLDRYLIDLLESGAEDEIALLCDTPTIMGIREGGFSAAAASYRI